MSAIEAGSGIPASVTALLSGVVDYAGIFPPAALSMADALRDYREAQSGPDAWMLGRFVVTASRLSELIALTKETEAPLHLSVIVADAASDLSAVAAARSASTSVLVDAIECKADTMQGVERIAATVPGAEIYVEIDPAAGALHSWMAFLASRRLRAKIRTGGITATAFPTARIVVAFMDAALKAGVPFKATAGLHHAVRGPYRLTYAPGADEAVMYGYLNVLLAAASLRAGVAASVAEAILVETDASQLSFSSTAIRWRGHHWSTASLEATRTMLVGFGSCSISEPASEIRSLASLASPS
jgi:hypothetical protein